MNIYEKMNLIMNEVKSLQKDGQVAFGKTKYNYLSESKTTETLREQFIKHKLVLYPCSIEEKKEGSLTIQHAIYRLVNIEEPSEYIDIHTTGQGHDSADKGSGKASSYAYKYLLWRTFAIPSNDDPDQICSDEIVEKDLASNKKIDKTKAETVESLIQVKHADLVNLLKYYKIKNIKDMSISQYAHCMKMLKAK